MVLEVACPATYIAIPLYTVGAWDTFSTTVYYLRMLAT